MIVKEQNTLLFPYKLVKTSVCKEDLNSDQKMDVISDMRSAAEADEKDQQNAVDLENDVIANLSQTVTQDKEDRRNQAKAQFPALYAAMEKAVNGGRELLSGLRSVPSHVYNAFLKFKNKLDQLKPINSAIIDDNNDSVASEVQKMSDGYPDNSESRNSRAKEELIDAFVDFASVSIDELKDVPISEIRDKIIPEEVTEEVI